MPDPDHLLYLRRVLLAAMNELVGTAREVRLRGGDQRPLLEEALRVGARLKKVQKEIEKHDLD